MSNPVEKQVDCSLCIFNKKCYFKKREPIRSYCGDAAQEQTTIVNGRTSIDTVYGHISGDTFYAHDDDSTPKGRQLEELDHPDTRIKRNGFFWW